MWKYFWSFRSLQFSDLKSQGTAASLLNTELMTSVPLLECAPIGNKNTTFSIQDLKYRKSSIKPQFQTCLKETSLPGALQRIYFAERAVCFYFCNTGPRGWQAESRYTNGLYWKRDRDGSKYRGKCFFLCHAFFKEDLKPTTKHR